jgi:hypothetical protein
MAYGEITPPTSIFGRVHGLRRVVCGYLSRLNSCHFLRNLLIHP